MEMELLKKSRCLLYLLIFTVSQAFANCTCCEKPEQGAPGPEGPQGITGPVGPTGPQGSIRPTSIAFVTFVYEGIDQVVAAQDTIIFPTTNVLEGAISYDPLTGVFTLLETGYYLVRFGVSGSPNNDQVALKLNNNLLPVAGSQLDIQNNLLQGIGVIFNVTTPASTLELINNEASANIAIATSNTGSLAAYLLIRGAL